MSIDPRTVQVGDLELWPDHFRARWKGTEVQLTIRQYVAVEHLASLRRVASWQEIYEAVRGDAGGDGVGQTVRTWITRIRKAFRAVDPNFDEIEVHDGFGY